MFFCDPCRIKKAWPRSTGYPYIGLSYGKCEVCRTECWCYEVPVSKLTPESEKSNTQKTAEKTIQQEYKRKAEDLAMYRLSGIMDIQRTGLLRQIIAQTNGMIDWKTTYELRMAALQGYRREEEMKRDRR